MAYTQGNLATKPKEQQKEPGRVRIRETRKVVYKARTIPVQEKLIYLFTVFVCVVVAGVIIWRYAQIYEMNRNIQNIQVELKKLEAENSTLKQEVNKLMDPNRLKQEVEKKGLKAIDETQVVHVPANPAAQAPDAAAKP
ncbi:cell division protein FtsL [Paenibacillus contaminans]|jgi:cell division protein FtsL|uniref:Cell division protein FtsL n=1 Tax=Paenibacillus contaminans TaxID=450362 RepID=A0A329MIL4_9BACL|nr:cell division protein FtsL [Paenibacillus contaminans]RAV19801.1 cell division protein FtsL [Paenibacillus contaminans]